MLHELDAACSMLGIFLFVSSPLTWSAQRRPVERPAVIYELMCYDSVLDLVTHDIMSMHHETSD